jgi:hypothetical protein
VTSRRRLPRAAVAAARRPLVPPAPEHRDPITPDALNAALGAHMSDEHEGHVGRGCRTCARYIAARTSARARERQP